jgi:hypothetical protein
LQSIKTLLKESYAKSIFFKKILPGRETVQNFILGIMVALTPSMILLSILLWRAPVQDTQHSM